MKKYTLISEKQLPESEVLFEIEIPSEVVSHHKAHALKHIAEEISVPGFRKGHVPEKIAAEKVGDFHILEEASYEAIKEILPDLISEKKLFVIGTPNISITKLANDNVLAFTATFGLVPEFTLPDYKKIASGESSKKQDEAAVSEKEVDDFISTLLKSRASETENPPTELTDEIAKTLGNFKTAEDLKKIVRESLLSDKNARNKEKKRLKIMESILGEAVFDAPRVLVENELDKLLARLQDDISRSGLTLADYLKETKKTEADLRKEWRSDAVKRARLQIILDKISKEEKIVASEKEVRENAEHLARGHKDVDPELAKAYVSIALRNEKVLEFLEEQL